MWLPSFLQIKSSDPDVRLQAVRRVAESDSERALHALMEAFRDENPQVGQAAAIALGRKGTEDGIMFLLKGLQDPSPLLRQAAVDGLKATADTRVHAALVDVLRDFNPGVRGRAANALAHAQWRPEKAEDEIWFAVAQGQLLRAAKHGSAAISALEMVLDGGPYNLQVSAVRALGSIPDERVLKSLIAVLESTDHAVCVAGIEALSNFGGPKAIESLLPMVNHRDHRVRVAVVEAMSQLEAQQVIPSLVKLLKDSMWDVRCATATTLGKLRSHEGVEPLIGVLRDLDNDVREAAANSLGRIGDARAIGPLVLSLADPETGVRRSAASALRFISPNWQQSEAAQRMRQDLRKALESGDLAVRYAATTTLEQIGSSAGTLEHEIATVLTAAVQKQNRVLSVFVELLNDSDADLRFIAATALGNLKEQRATAALKPLLTDADDAVRRAATESLAILEIS